MDARRDRQLLLDAEVLPQCPDRNDEFPQQSEIPLDVVSRQSGALRVTAQRDRLRRRRTVIDRVPQLLSEEWHERREHPQRSLEGLQQRRERGPGVCLIGGLAEVEPQLDDFQIPVAEVAPEKLI